MKLFSFLSLFLLSCLALSAQGFQFIEAPQVQLSSSEEVYFPLESYRTLSVDLASFRQILSSVPDESEVALGKSRVSIELPLPDGQLQHFNIVESAVLQAEDQLRWPQLRTYRILDHHNPAYNGRMSVTPNGVIAYFSTVAGDVIVEPFSSGSNYYHRVYYIKDITQSSYNLPQLSCGFQADESISVHSNNTPPTANTTAKTAASTVKEFILALTCTGEYAAIKGGTVESVMASFVEGMSIGNAVFEREVGVRVTLIGNVEQLIYLNAGTDPFVNADNGGELLSQVRNAITSAGFPTTAYDMGHVFTAGCTDVGGVVGGNTCTSGKDRGVTCHYSGSISSIIRNVFVHEIAHQFGVAHSWSNCPGNEGQLASNSAYEPGSGTTIMSYSGACGNQNVGGGGNNVYYHGHSLDQFISFITEGNGAGCATIIPTENTQPKLTLNYNDGFYIPISTPFELIAFAEDEQDDPLTYCWEQMDLGPQTPLGAPLGNTPIFRSYPPNVAPNRVFPRIPILVNNQMEDTEVLPTYSRDLTFRCTVRDNNPEVGDLMQQDIAFKSTSTAGPFLVMSPNDGTESWQVGSTQEVTWDVANTTNDLVNCQLVNIRLSADGGQTYPHTLIEGTPNNGSALVSVPNVTGSNMRIRVDAADNIFFDISNTNFSITPATAPTYTLDYGPIFQQLCLPNTAEVSFNTAAILDYNNNISFSIANELPDGVVASFSADEVQPGTTTALTIDMENLTGYDGPLEVIVAAATSDLDTVFRTVYFTVVDNDFSDLTLLTPVQGATGIQLGADFSWTAIPNADTYEWQISDDAAFTNILDSRSGLTTAAATPDFQFAANTLFFWRVRPSNACGAGAWSTPYVFHTINAICSPLQAEDTPVNIPGTGPLPTRKTEIFVPINGVISDINIPYLRVGYQPIQNFSITLISPAGTRVILYNRNCFSVSEVTVGFDDEAPTDIVCPPNTGNLVKPLEPLAAFVGENSEGIWTLEVRVFETGFGAPGTIGDWNIEFCAAGNAVGPAILMNDTLFVQPSMGNPITTDLLNVNDTEQGPSELVYSIVNPPVHGTLYVVDNELEPGSTFTQTTINAGNLYYLNTNPDAVFDAFNFVVQDGTGGFLPVQRFNIKIDENAVVGTQDIEPAAVFKLFPNPTSDQVTVQWSTPLSQAMPLRVLNMNGQVLLQTSMAAGKQGYAWTTNNWPAGIYLVQMGDQTLKLVKER